MRIYHAHSGKYFCSDIFEITPLTTSLFTPNCIKTFIGIV